MSAIAIKLRAARAVLVVIALGFAVLVLRALERLTGAERSGARVALEELVRRAAYGPPPTPRPLGPIMRVPPWNVPEAMRAFVAGLRARRGVRS